MPQALSTSISLRTSTKYPENRTPILPSLQPVEIDAVVNPSRITRGMSADFWAGYISGAIGIVVGNPLDLVKTRIQAGPSVLNETTARGPNVHGPWTKQFERWSALVRGAAAPILGYGALNALLFVTYNRSLALLNTGNVNDWPERPSGASIWAAGALGGLASFVVSAPTELVKCRAQVSSPPKSSWQVTTEMWKSRGIRGMYMGGGVTSIRDSVGYGF